MLSSVISDEDVKSIVSQIVDDSKEAVRIVNHTVEPFSRSRHGIMGNHYILSIEMSSNNSGGPAKTLKFFVKTPPDSPTLRDKIVDEWVSLEEIHFFSKIYPLFRKVSGKSPKWCPTCYVSRAELLVFEDLRSQNYSIRQNSIYDESTLKSVLASLARFHASSILAEAELARPLTDVYPEAFREKIFTDAGKGGRANKLGFQTMELLAQRFGLDGSIVPKILQRICEIVKPVRGSLNVLCHGDLWRSNVMLDDTQQPPKCMLVDLQMLRYSSPALDIAQLVFVHTTPEFRQNSEYLMTRYYHEILTETLRACGFGGEILAYEQLEKDYRQRRLVGMAYSALRWPPIVMFEMRNHEEALEKFYFHSRIDVYTKLMDDDVQYEEAMRGYLVELFQEGRRVLNL